MNPLTLFAVTSAIVVSLGSLKENKSDYVCLIADEDGKVGKVVIFNESGEKVIDKDKYFVSIKEKELSDPLPLPEEKFQKLFGNLLSAEPKKPKNFQLYFEQGSINLTSESLLTLNDISSEIKKRENVEVIIIGHTDSVGSKDINYKLGLERAETVKTSLLENKIIDHNTYVEILSHGEDDPIIPTPDETPEPKNRRVEIVIR